MTNEYKIEIPGKPVGKARPKFYRRGKFVGTYNPQETEEGKWILLARSQIRQKFDGAVSIKAHFFFPILKSWSKKKKEYCKQHFIPHVKKPDLDNCIKFVCDCLNELAWHDDSQIYMFDAIKSYAIEGKTVLYIRELNC